MKKGTVTVLGSATSMGVPTIGCDCAVCRSSDPRDRRTRPSVMIEWEGHRIVIDSGPDFREQAVREGINRLDAVLYTHGHADHILGLDDLRPLTYPRVTGGGRLPLYATPETARFCSRYSNTSSMTITNTAASPRWSCARSTGRLSCWV